MVGISILVAYFIFYMVCWVKIISNLNKEHFEGVFTNSWIVDGSKLNDEGQKYRRAVLIITPIVFVVLCYIWFWSR